MDVLTAYRNYVAANHPYSAPTFDQRMYEMNTFNPATWIDTSLNPPISYPPAPKPMAPPTFFNVVTDFLKGTKPDAIIAGFSPDQINQNFSDNSQIALGGANLNPTITGAPSTNLPYLTSGKYDPNSPIPFLGGGLGWLFRSPLGWVILLSIAWLGYKAFKKK